MKIGKVEFLFILSASPVGRWREATEGVSKILCFTPSVSHSLDSSPKGAPKPLNRNLTYYTTQLKIETPDCFISAWVTFY